MFISRLLSLFVALILVAGVVPTIRAGSAGSEVVSNGKVLLDCFQRPPGSASPADRGAAADWVARHAASVNAGNALSGYVQRQPSSASPANTAAPDWVERHAASRNAGNAVDLSNCYQPGSTIPADPAAPDWVERHAASL
jgi:hypothetical protein